MGQHVVAWQQLGSTGVTQSLLNLGFNWIVVDMEHSSIGTETAENIFALVNNAGRKPLVRLPSSDHFLARRMLDGGAKGIIVPVVESASVLSEFTSHCLYPPNGKRGVGLVQANQWGLQFDKYFKTFIPLIIAQIETKKGIENLPDILKLDHLYGIMVGPFDLSADIGIPGDFNNPIFQTTLETIFSLVKESDKKMGYHQVEPDNKKLKSLIKKGFDFVAYGTDITAINSALNFKMI